LSRDEVGELVGRPVAAELATDRSAPVRGERGEPPSVGRRAPFGVVVIDRKNKTAPPCEVGQSSTAEYDGGFRT